MMNQIKKVESWQCTDGEVFKSEYDALRHQIEIDIDKALEIDAIVGTYAGSYALTDDVKDWILDHANLVKRYIELYPPKNKR